MRHDNNLIAKQVAQQTYLKRLASIVVCVLSVSSIYLIDQRPAIVSFDKACLAIGIIWVSLYPSLQYLLDRNRPPMPFLPLVGIFYATSFGLPIFAGELSVKDRFSLSAVDARSLTLVLLALIAMNVAFYFSKSFIWKSFLPFILPRNYSLKKILNLVWTFLLLHLAYLYFPFVKSLPSIDQLLIPIAYISYGMLFILWQRNLLSSTQKTLIMVVFLPLELVPRLASGLLSEVMILGLFMIIIAFAETKKLPMTFIAIALGVYLIFSPVKSEFRDITWKSSSSLNSLERVQLFTDLVFKHFSTPANPNTPKVSEGDKVVSRSAHIKVFSAVVRDTPSKVPYWNGESYLPLFTNYIPRILWPDKPSEKTGNNFGRRYGYLDSTDSSTSFNLPWIVEMYANFGESGVMIGMSLVGVFLAFLDQKFNHPRMQPLELVTGCTIIFNLIYQESNFSLMTGSVILLTVSLYLIYNTFLAQPVSNR